MGQKRGFGSRECVILTFQKVGKPRLPVVEDVLVDTPKGKRLKLVEKGLMNCLGNWPRVVFSMRYGYRELSDNSFPYSKPQRIEKDKAGGDG